MTSPSGAASVEVVGCLFPDDVARIHRLAEKDDSFRILCEDYALALHTLTQLKLRSLINETDRIIEYQIILEDLARELKNAIKPNGG